MEEWIEAARYPSYEVSTYGRVRNKQTHFVLTPPHDRYGYLRLSLGYIDNVYVHRLVCESFFGPAPIGKGHVNHIDGNRSNNSIHNLEWCSPSENIKWSVDAGRINPMIGLSKAKEVNEKPVRIIEIDRTFPSVKECAEFLSVAPSNVSRCLVGARRGQRLHGYHIEFCDKRRPE